MRGRKPVPTELKILRGNPGHRPLNTEEPKPPSTGEPAVPTALILESRLKCTMTVPCQKCAKCRAAWTAREAITEWRKRAPQLYKIGVLTDVDTSAFEAYCRAWGRYQNAEARVTEQGEVVATRNGHPMQNPYRSIANKAMTECQKFWAEFGMTPSSRSRVHVPGHSATKDPFAEFDEPMVAPTPPPKEDRLN